MPRLSSSSLRLALPLLLLAAGCGGEEPVRSAACREGAPVRVSGRLLVEGSRALNGVYVQVSLLRQDAQGRLDAVPLIFSADTGLDALPERFELCAEAIPRAASDGSLVVVAAVDLDDSERLGSAGDLEGRAAIESGAEVVQDVEIRLMRLE